jgi:hypothetical protein
MLSTGLDRTPLIAGNKYHGYGAVSTKPEEEQSSWFAAGLGEGDPEFEGNQDDVLISIIGGDSKPDISMHPGLEEFIIGYLPFEDLTVAGVTAELSVRKGMRGGLLERPLKPLYSILNLVDFQNFKEEAFEKHCPGFNKILDMFSFKQQEAICKAIFKTPANYKEYCIRLENIEKKYVYEFNEETLVERKRRFYCTSGFFIHAITDLLSLALTCLTPDFVLIPGFVNVKINKWFTFRVGFTLLFIICGGVLWRYGVNLQLNEVPHFIQDKFLNFKMSYLVSLVSKKINMLFPDDENIEENISVKLLQCLQDLNGDERDKIIYNLKALSEQLPRLPSESSRMREFFGC